MDNIANVIKPMQIIKCVLKLFIKFLIEGQLLQTYLLRYSNDKPS
jgi:hypothetical protein